jgi:hypothetical protein
VERYGVDVNDAASSLGWRTEPDRRPHGRTYTVARRIARSRTLDEGELATGVPGSGAVWTAT